MQNPYSDKAFQEEVQQIVKDGIKRGLDARDAPEREQQTFQQSVAEIARNSRIIK